ncbi:MAG: glycosyltransferase [bacterium]|nr:glycosyltransferase [bacterium]
MNFSVVIPTYNRPDDLNRCLDSILGQLVKPVEIIIVDDGNLPDIVINNLKIKIEDKKINFIYYKKNHKYERRGSSESRNKALELSRNNVVFILDDDVILEEYDFFEKIIKIWSQNTDKNLIGIGGKIKNERKINKLENIYNHIFGLIGKCKWDVNNVGFQVWDQSIKNVIKSYYVHGGVCSYNKKLTQKIGFTTFNEGRTALEDVDFCLRAKNQGYFFLLEPNARVIHNQSLVAREKEFVSGFKEEINRRIIFKNNCKKNIKNYLWFVWANIGWILRQFLAGHFIKGVGMIKGSLPNLK